MYELDREIFRDEAEISIDSSNRRFRAIFLLPSISLTVRTSCASRRRQGDAKFPPWKSTLPWQVRVRTCVSLCVCVMLSLCTTTVVETSRNEHSPRTTVCEHGTIENNCRKTFDSSNKRSSPEFCLLSIGRFSFFFFFFHTFFFFIKYKRSAKVDESYLILL